MLSGLQERHRSYCWQSRYRLRHLVRSLPPLTLSSHLRISRPSSRTLRLGQWLSYAIDVCASTRVSHSAEKIRSPHLTAIALNAGFCVWLLYQLACPKTPYTSSHRGQVRNMVLAFVQNMPVREQDELRCFYFNLPLEYLGQEIWSQVSLVSDQPPLFQRILLIWSTGYSGGPSWIHPICRKGNCKT